MCSSILQHNDVKDTGLLFAGFCLLLFLNIGEINAFFRCCRIFPWPAMLDNYCQYVVHFITKGLK